jgi:hypothetical protein
MGLRDTFEKLATDFAYEILSVVKAGRLDEVLRVKRRPQGSLPSHPPNGAVDPPAALPEATHVEPGSPIRIPAEKVHLRLDALLLTNRLWNVLSREGYAVLGDLDGRTFADLTQHRGFGRQCQKELRRLLAGGRTNRSAPQHLRPLVKLHMRSRIRVLAARRDVHLADIGLSPHVHALLARHGYVVLGDLEGRTPASLIVHEGFGPRCDRELRRALVERKLVVGPGPKARRRAPRARSHRRDNAGDEQATIVDQDAPTPEAASNPVVHATFKVRRAGEIRIPAEKRQLRLNDLDLSTRLWNVLWREGYVLLGDLDGLTPADLSQHRGFGRVCKREIRDLLEVVGAVGPPTPFSQPADPLVADDAPSRSDPPTIEPPALDVRVRAPGRLPRSLTIHIPAEHRQAPVNDLPVSARLFNTLDRHGYVVLGDLDGRTFGHLGAQRGFGRGCQRDLRDLLVEMGIAPTLPTPTKLDVPAFAREYRLDELRLSGRSQKFVKRASFTVLGDFHEKSTSELWGAEPKVIDEFASIIESMAVNGPPKPGGLLDHLDGGLDALKERHRQVLLLRLGGAGEAPLTLAEIARRLNVTPERVRQVQGHALARLPGVAGPGFGAALRDLEARVSVVGAEVAAEFERSWRPREPSTEGTREPRPWANTGFYVRLLSKLSPGIEAAVYPPTVRPN